MATTSDSLYLQLAEVVGDSATPGRTEETRTRETSDRDAVLAGQLLALGAVGGGGR